MAKFKNPANEHIENSSGALSWLWALLFTWIYFLCKGNIKAAAIVFVLEGVAFSTIFLGIGIFLYPLFRIAVAVFCYKINDNYYLHRGWIKVADEENVIRAKEEMKAKATKSEEDKTE